MRRALAALGLLLSCSTPALATRFTGLATSDAGGSATLIARVRLVRSSLVGRIRCRSGSLLCLFRRARLSALVDATTFPENMTFAFTGGVRNRDVYCTVTGLVTFTLHRRRHTVTALEQGRYGCTRRDGAVDAGSFSVR